MLHQLMHGKPFIYFDSAATAQKPRSVIDAMSRFYAEQYGTVHRSVYDFASQATTRYNEVRKKVKEFLNAAFVEEIVFTRGTTDGDQSRRFFFWQSVFTAGRRNSDHGDGASFQYCPLADDLSRKRGPSQSCSHERSRES